MSKDHIKLINEWPFRLLLPSEQNPLRSRLNLELAPMSLRREFVKGAVRSYRDQKVDEQLTFLSIPTANGFALDLALPRDISTHRRGEMVKIALENTNTLTDEDITHLLDLNGASYISLPFTYKGIKIPTICRRMSVGEVGKHALSALESIGFPIPDVAEDLGQYNQKLAEDIMKKQVRYLNKRGISVPLQVKELRDLGYSRINFYKDSSDKEKIRAEIMIGNVPYAVTLDRYFNFDLEGKSLGSSVLSESIRFTLLSLLKPIVCEVKVKTPSGEVEDLDREVVSRMGHLRWLTGGQHYSKQAEDNHLEHEGKDLCAVGLERQERNKGTEKEKMETTYVRPVIDKEAENLPPITLHLPDALKFSSTIGIVSTA